MPGSEPASAVTNRTTDGAVAADPFAAQKPVASHVFRRSTRQDCRARPTVT